MTHRVFILGRAAKELAAIPADVFGAVRDSVESLGDNPRPAGCVKLKGREGWRIRVGRYRVVYEIDDCDRVVTVLHIGHRRDIYR